MIVKEFDRWLEEQIQFLKSHSWEKLDTENLIEELQDLGNELKNAAKSFTRRIIEHLLYCEYWEEERDRNLNHWQHEILLFRQELSDRLTTNLRKYLQEELDRLYSQARKIAFAKCRLDTLPQDCPYSIEEILG